MRRASIERPRAMREWQRRSMVDDALAPGHFRKGRRVKGCPRVCAHCRRKKATPTRQVIRADLELKEWAQ